MVNVSILLSAKQFDGTIDFRKTKSEALHVGSASLCRLI